MVRLSHKHIFKTQLKKITLFDQKLKRRVFEDVLCAPPPKLKKKNTVGR